MDTLRIDHLGPITTVRISRPEVRNAFNDRVVAELTQAFTAFPASTRVVVLTGEGTVFCAGADLGWMKQSRAYTETQNLQDAGAMAAMFRAIDECAKPVIGRIQGLALGGGCGLIACCDVAVAVDEAQFGFSEVRLGIIPAVISTFVIDKIGARAARRWFLTGERFSAAEAREMGLLHEVVKPDQLDARVAAIAQQILQSGPVAVAEAKTLVREIRSMPREVAVGHTVRTIARIRVSPEGQEGFDAFLGKRKPKWAWME